MTKCYPALVKYQAFSQMFAGKLKLPSLWFFGEVKIASDVDILINKLFHNLHWNLLLKVAMTPQNRVGMYFISKKHNSSGMLSAIFSWEIYSVII